MGKSSKSAAVAVIGYSLRLPGAPNREAFWQLLSEGRCAISRVPADRFPAEAFYHPRAGADVPGRSYSFAAGILDDVWSFDPVPFGISPREAAQVDPQQRMLLEVAYEAIEHAGLKPSQLARSRTGVYVGASSSDYATRFMFDPGAIDMHMMTGNTLSLASNRVSYCFDLRGPSFTVDTACSSSLFALHLAMEAIGDGRIDTAIVGGVNLLLSPFSFLGFARASMLSPSGLCKAFDAGGDGYVRAEGALALVLRAEKVAAQGGDRVHAVLVGSGINQDGRTTGLSLPSPDAQAALLAGVYARAGVSPERLAFIEAHGTGTRVGDPAEAHALGTVLGQKRSSPLPIGSVKTNIGHLEPASGLAGVIKAIMALEHDTLPASLHFNEPNPDIRFDELNVAVAAKAVPLAKTRHLRHAGVNSFGFGGANAHVILREPRRPAAGVTAGPQEPVPLILSACGAEALTSLAGHYAAALPRPTAASDMANAAAHGRDLLSERLVVTGADAGAALAAQAAGQSAAGVYRGAALGHNLDVAFAFSGNGSQWVGMGLPAYRSDRIFRAALERFDAHFAPLANWSAIEALHSPDLGTEIRKAGRAQPLLLALQVAIVETLRERGVTPSLVIGHSVGEIAAAWCAGALDLDNAIRVVLARSHRQEATRHRGGMAVAVVSVDAMRSLLDHDSFRGLEIAAINSGRNVSVAGPDPAIAAFLEYAEQERWGAKRLDVDYPFHCALVEPIKRPLLDDLAGLKCRATDIPMISTVTGAEIAGDDLDARYWWRNVRSPVDFMGGMQALCQRGLRVIVEIGPQQVLGSYLHDALRRHDARGAVVQTLVRDPERQSDELVAAAARILVAGGRVDLARFVGPMRRPLMSVPHYAWQRRKIDFPATREGSKAYAALAHPLLGNVFRDGSGEWFASVDPGLFPWLDDHKVEAASVFPAAAFIEIAFAAARETLGDGALELRDFEIGQPLTFDKVRAFEVATRVSHESRAFEIRSRARGGADDWLVNVRGSMALSPAATAVPDLPAGPARDSCDADAIYGFAARRGFRYGAAFRRVASVDVFDDRTACARLTEAPPPSDRFILDPTSLDAAFHTLFALTQADHGVPETALLLPVRVGMLRVYHPGRAVAQVTVRVTAATSRSRVADFDLHDADGHVVASLRQARCRVVPRDTRHALDALTYRMRFVETHRASQPSALSEAGNPAECMTRAAHARPESKDMQDVALISRAGALAAAASAIAEVAGRAKTFSIPALVADGRLEMSSWPLMSRLLLALSDAGAVTTRGPNWDVTDSADLTPVQDLVSLLVTRYPAFIAEATCLARMPTLLADLLRQGLEAGLGYNAATLDHLERGSPAATRLADVTAAAAADLLARWPQGRPVRVLVVGCANGAIADALAAPVAALHGTVIVTDPNRQEIARARLHHGAGRGVAFEDWDAAIDGSGGGYDLILCARSLTAIANMAGRFERLASVLRKGGALLAAEPSPGLFDDLVHGTTPAWWAQSVNPDFPIGATLSADDWRRLLDDAGLQDCVVQAFEPDGVNGVLISAVARHGMEAGAAERSGAARPMIVVTDASSASQAFADLLRTRLDGPSKVVALHGAEARRARVVTLQEGAVPPGALDEGKAADVIFLAAPRLSAHHPVAALSQQAMTLIHLVTLMRRDEGVRFWMVCRGAVSGVVDEEPANPVQTGLWSMARVLQNEYPDIEMRCIDLDPALAMDAAASHVAEAIIHCGPDREMRLNASGQSVLRLQRGGLLAPPTNEVGDDATMRLDIGQAGSLDSLAWRPVARRALKPGEITLDVSAAGLNFRDVMWSLGLLPEEALENGFTGPAIGMECAGVVSAVGAGVTAFSVGDRVVAFAADAFASRVVVTQDLAAKLPADLSLEAAATLPVAFLTAYYALVRLAQLRKGETVLIHGGAGGVGLAALQIARLRGATVIATAGNADRRALLCGLGADHVLDSRSLAFADEVRGLTGGAGVDVVLNSLAGEAMIRSLDCLKPFGRFLELGKRDYYMNRHVGLRPFRNNLSYFGIDADQLLTAHRPVAEELFAELMALIEAGELSPLPYRVFDAPDAAAAFRLMQQSGHVGKILIRPPQAPPPGKARPAFRIDPHGRYLIVGGLGGFGLATADWLAGKGARHLVLMGRSATPDAQAGEAVAALRAKGANVDLVAVDVADRDALERYLGTIAVSDRPLKGVFHAAMVLDDALARDLDRSRVETVLRAKVGGTANLDQLTRRFDLDCFVLYSSVAALVGNIGQASYVAANAYLEGLARRRRSEGLPALAVQWGAIEDVGYLARNASVNSALSRRLGRAALSASEALVALDALLGRDQRKVGEAVVGFGRIAWSLVKKELAVSRTPLFRDLHLDDAAGEGATLAAEDLLRQLRELPDAEVEARLSDIIADNIARTLRLPSVDLDRERPLSDIGMDSLMMLELRMAVEEQMGIEVPLMSLTSSLTVVDIGKRLASMLRNQDKALMSSQMSALTQGHLAMPDAVSDADIAAAAAAVARRARTVDSIL